MLQHLARLMFAVAVWGLSTGVAHAVSLGKIEVASGLGEPFYAEIPLSVDAGENLQAVKVSIADGSDYRILEVYRDSALNLIRTDVESDSRGTRVELRSTNPIDAPFFNLVLRVQYDRATQFKKFPIFLDLPKAARAPAAARPVPTVKAVEGMAPATSSTPVTVMPAAPAQATAEPKEPQAEAATPTHAFQPYDGWARISRYGPMVYGDTISTVAKRLRVDDRFTQQQVMVALFEKNRQKFDQDNINLIKAGTYLDVPTAAEVSRISSAQARSVIAEHEKRWKELTRQPRYAAVEEAQRTRYSKRIRIGEQASGTAAAPMSTESEQGKAPGGTEPAAAPGTAQAPDQSNAAASAEVEKAKAEVEQLTQKNQELQAKLAESDKKLQDLAGKMSEEGQAAQEQTRKKLELQVARLQAELDRARDQAKVAETSAGPDWLTWALGGLVVVLLGAVGFLIRREPKHPATMTETEPAVASSYASEEPYAGYAAPEEEEVPEIEVEEADVEAASDYGDFGDSTMRISPEDAVEFSNSIPDLTDEDTSEMEAFQEEVEEEPDPNVDYLSEADVYLRYGMEDEALQQVNMALKQDPHNPEAYIKLAQIHRQKGDEQAFDEAVASANGVLSGDALARFSDAVAELQAGEADASSLEDTMPPTEASEMIGSDADESAGEAGVDLGEGLDLGGIDFEDVGGTAEAEIAGAEETLVEPTFEAPEAVEEEGAEAAEAAADDLSFDLSGMDMGEETASEAEAEDAGASVSSGGGLDFDLSDFEVPEEPAQPAESDEGPEVSTADLESTVAIDWSQDTSVDSGEQQISGESGAVDMFEETGGEIASQAEAAEADAGSADDLGELDFDLSGLDVDAASEAESAAPEMAAGEATQASQADEGPAPLDLDAGDLDAGMDLSEIEVEAADDFTSTITSTVDNVSASDVDFTATGEHDLQMTAGAASSGDDSDDGGLLNLDFDSDDQDATQQLEDLLSEFSDEDDEKKDQ